MPDFIMTYPTESQLPGAHVMNHMFTWTRLLSSYPSGGIAIDYCLLTFCTLDFVVA